MNVTDVPMYSDNELTAACRQAAADERAKLAAVMSPDQFRKLADWFDTDDEFKEAMFPDTWSPGSRQDDVQQDLRRFADLLAGTADGHNLRDPAGNDASLASQTHAAAVDRLLGALVDQRMPPLAGSADGAHTPGGTT